MQKSGKLKCSPLPMCNTFCMSLYGKTPFTKNTFDPVRSGKAANEHAKMWASAWPCPYTYRLSFEIPDKSYSLLLSTCLPSWLVYILSLYRRLVNGFLKVFFKIGSLHKPLFPAPQKSLRFDTNYYAASPVLPSMAPIMACFDPVRGAAPGRTENFSLSRT